MLIKEQLFRSEIAMSVMTSHEIWAYPIYMATPLMDSDFHGLKVTILKVFHCIYIPCLESKLLTEEFSKKKYLTIFSDKATSAPS